MERADIIMMLAERKLEHLRSIGLSPVKCKQMLAEQLPTWKNLSTERLNQLLEEGEAEY
jgi:hypothetical protein